jgi:hypothetical protein
MDEALLDWNELCGKTITSVAPDNSGWESQRIANSVTLAFSDGTTLRLEGECCCAEHAGVTLRNAISLP